METQKTLKQWLLALLVGVVSVPAVSVFAAEQPVDLTKAAETSVNSVVYIKVTLGSKTQTVEYADPFADFFGDFFGRGNGGGTQRRQVQTPKRQAAGSGVIVSPDGYIVTNNHVVSEADELSVKLNDNREFKARIIGTDKNSDLALIKIEGDHFPAIKMGNSDELKLGEWVLAVGNPFNLTSTVTAGVISAKARSIGANGVESFIQTDAAINQGNSGGALVNARGELVGINSMLYSQTGTFTGYGFAIPTTIVKKVVADLKEYGIVQRAMLGIEGLDVTGYVDEQKEKGKTVDLGTVDGVYVNDLSADGAAAEAGLEKGDVITAIGGKKINKMSELQETLAQHQPGDIITVTFLRNKKEQQKKLALRNVNGTTTVFKEIDVETLGVALKALSEETRRELKLQYGLEVIAVKAGKMQEAGISKGLILMQVNDKKMEKREDFEAVVKEAGQTADRVLWIRAKTKSGINKSFTVELDKPKTEKKK